MSLLADSPFLRRFVPVRREEIAATLWSFSYFFCLLCSYYLLRPVRDEMGIQGGVENLAQLFTGTFVIMLASVPLFGWASSRFPRAKLLPIVYLFFIVNLAIFYALMRSGVAPAIVARAFFIWTSVFNLFVVSVFWSFMADLFRNEQARRLYGLISAGGSAGALAGPLLATVLAPSLGPASLLPISAAMLCAAVLCIYRLTAWAKRNPAERRFPPAQVEEPLGGGIFAGITLALKSPYLLGICIYVMLGTLLGTFLYFHQANIMAVEMPSAGARTALFAKIDLAVNVLTFACQIFLVGRLMNRFGVGTTLMILPVMGAIGFFILGLMPTLAVLVIFQIIRRAGEYAIARPAREVLFTVLNREEKYKSKNFIDTVVFRSGDAASGWLFEGLRILGLGFAGIAFVGVPVALLWAGTGWMLGRSQDEMRARNEAIRRPDEKSKQAGAAPATASGGGNRRIDDGDPVVR
ncbi:MAG TPA: MFS transporter [Burkholderiales bacterium]|nr:MFS transporter [Burkholderiales bacterium]